MSNSSRFEANPPGYQYLQRELITNDYSQNAMGEGERKYVGAKDKE
jgi:hypothetical protein